MKKVKLVLMIFFGIFINHPSLLASSPSVTSMKAAPGEWRVNLKLTDLTRMNTKDVQKMTGKKMNFCSKIAFKIFQNKVKKIIRKHNDLTIADLYNANQEGKNKFSVLWFLIGLAGPWIGILSFGVAGLLLFTIAAVAAPYLLHRSKTEKGSLWTGLGLSLIMLLILVLIASSAIFSIFW